MLFSLFFSVFSFSLFPFICSRCLCFCLSFHLFNFLHSFSFDLYLFCAGFLFYIDSHKMHIKKKNTTFNIFTLPYTFKVFSSITSVQANFCHYNDDHKYVYRLILRRCIFFNRPVLLMRLLSIKGKCATSVNLSLIVLTAIIYNTTYDQRSIHRFSNRRQVSFILDLLGYFLYPFASFTRFVHGWLC